MTEREEIVERLRGVRLVEDSSFNTERIAAAICDYRGNILAELPLDECKKVRDKLISLLTETPAATSGERIAGELRHLATEWDWMDPEAGEPARKLRAIADRIDAKHEEAIQRKHEAAYDAGYRDGYACADDLLAEHEGALAERGWYRALDADKEVIHADDELFWKAGDSAGRVTGIGVGQLAGWVWVLPDGGTVPVGRAADLLHHKHPDSWERIIADAMWVADHDGEPDYHQQCVAELVARCKALAGDAE